MPVAHVQSTGVTDDAPGPSTAKAFGSNVALGNLILVVASRSTTGQVGTMASDTCADTRGTVYTRLDTGTDTVDTQGQVTFWGVTTGAGANTVTVTHDPGGPDHTFRRLCITEISGQAVASPVAAHSMNATAQTATTATDAVVSPSVTPAVINSLLWGCVSDTSGAPSIAPGTGFVEQAEFGGLQVETISLASAAAVTAKWTFGVADQYLAGAVVVSPVGGFVRPSILLPHSVSGQLLG